MELKRMRANLHFFKVRYLLIVPYGIETIEDGEVKPNQIKLLIVPYGIETKRKHRPIGRRSPLLIVPYGIETNQAAMQEVITVFF